MSLICGGIGGTGSQDDVKVAMIIPNIETEIKQTGTIEVKLTTQKIEVELTTPTIEVEFKDDKVEV